MVVQLGRGKGIGVNSRGGAEGMKCIVGSRWGRGLEYVTGIEGGITGALDGGPLNVACRF